MASLYQFFIISCGRFINKMSFRPTFFSQIELSWWFCWWNRGRLLLALLVIYIIGFTLLYFKMAVMPLVPETKMADVGKLISLGNLMARKTTWLVLTTTSTTSILSCVFGAYCMTGLCINSLVFQHTPSFTFSLGHLWWCNG